MAIQMKYRGKMSGPWRKVSSLVAVLAVGALAASCGGDDDAAVAPGTTASPDVTTPAGSDVTDPTGSDTTAVPGPADIPDDADPDGLLRIATNFTIGSPYEIDPRIGTTNSYNGIQHLIYGTPLYQDAGGVVQPYLADGYEITSPTTVVLTLRDGLTFQDGQLYDAETVKDALDAKLESDHASYARAKDLINSIEVDSASQLTFITNGDRAAMIPLELTLEFGHIAAPESDPLLPVGAGPYAPIEYRQAAYLSLEKWDGFFRSDEYGVRTIEYFDYPARDAAINALSADQVDLISVPPSDAQALVGTGSFESVTTNNGAFYVLAPCGTAPPFDDVRFREAFSLAINRQQINDIVFGGEVLPVAGLKPEGTPFAFEGEISEQGDQERARELLADIGAEGATVRATHFQVPIHQRIMEVIQAQMAEVGIDFELIPVQTGQNVPDLVSPETGGGISLTTNGFIGVATIVVNLPTGQVHLGVCPDQEIPERLQELTDQLLAGALEGDEEASAWQEVQTIFAEEHLQIPLVTQPATYVFNPRVRGLQPGTVGLQSATAPGPFLEGVYILAD